jgi:hypothetical protein
VVAHDACGAQSRSHHVPGSGSVGSKVCSAGFRSIVGVLGVGFSAAPAGCSDSVVRDSIFMVTELCCGGSLREKVLEQMVAGRKVPILSTAHG